VVISEEILAIVAGAREETARKVRQDVVNRIVIVAGVLGEMVAVISRDLAEIGHPGIRKDLVMVVDRISQAQEVVIAVNSHSKIPDPIVHQSLSSR
jgi:hypothetical protein